MIKKTVPNITYAKANFTLQKQLKDGENYLFAIAIDKYNDSKILPLNNAVLDAEKFVEILTQKFGFELISNSLYNENATRTNIIEKLNSLTYLLTEEDSLIIYFAGHGDLNPKRKKDIGYLMILLTQLVTLYQIQQSLIYSLE